MSTEIQNNVRIRVDIHKLISNMHIQFENVGFNYYKTLCSHFIFYKIRLVKENIIFSFLFHFPFKCQ